MIRADIILTPRDGLFCKDGRGWFTSSSGRGHALDWPYPSTVMGALRSAWGRARELQRGRRFEQREWPEQTADLRLGPVLALRRAWAEPWAVDHRLWPAPADARALEDGTVERLVPRPPTVTTLGVNDDRAREQLWTARSSRHKPAPMPSWWTERSFVAWLAGSSSVALDPTLTPVRRVQTHVGIDRSTGTAEAQVLYSHDLVETVTPAGQWGLGCRLRADEQPAIAQAPLGSDRRLAGVEHAPAALFAPPAAVLDAFEPGVSGLYLFTVSPAVFEAGWLPDGLRRRDDDDRYRGQLPGLACEVELRAAFVGRAQAVSGWDMARGRPKPTSRVVPPGSVYAFTRADGQPFTADHARALWLASVGQRRDEGFGVVVPGVWRPTPE